MAAPTSNLECTGQSFRVSVLLQKHLWLLRDLCGSFWLQDLVRDMDKLVAMWTAIEIEVGVMMMFQPCEQ